MGRTVPSSEVFNKRKAKQTNRIFHISVIHSIRTAESQPCVPLVYRISLRRSHYSVTVIFKVILPSISFFHFDIVPNRCITTLIFDSLSPFLFRSRPLAHSLPFSHVISLFRFIRISFHFPAPYSHMDTADRPITRFHSNKNCVNNFKCGFLFGMCVCVGFSCRTCTRIEMRFTQQTE